MPKFFVERDTILDGKVALSAEDAHHARDVLRVRPGEKLTVSDFLNREYLCRVLSADAAGVLLQIEAEREVLSEPPFPITLLMALPKGDKPEFIIEKSVELGVQGVRFFTSRCTVVRCDEQSAAKKRLRYEKIAKNAAQQCGRGIVPTVHAVSTFDSEIERFRGSDALKILCYEKEEARTLKNLLDPAETPREIVFMVGAEGGFTEEEARRATDAGFLPVTLGRRILRCETAPLYVLSALSYRYGY